MPRIAILDAPGVSHQEIGREHWAGHEKMNFFLVIILILGNGS
jgi:hypothetical protein